MRGPTKIHHLVYWVEWVVQLKWFVIVSLRSESGEVVCTVKLCILYPTADMHTLPLISCAY